MADDIPSTPMVEATSLASLLELATTPPSRPTPFQPGTAPLVLYIARVPGSRDVFLTPIKPREKVVTASDVQSSLYYVHYNGPREDNQHTRSKDSLLKSSSVNTNAADLHTISGPHSPRSPQSPKRKALPPPLPRRPGPPVSPPYPTDENEKPTLPPRPGSLKLKVPRKPVLPSRSSARESEDALPVLPPRPLPPTPPQEEEKEEEEPASPSLHEANIRLLRRESHTNETSNPYQRDYSTHPETLKQQELDSMPEPGTLTLIRRNPVSNEQWNVATIHDPPVQEVSSSSFPVPTAKRRAVRKGGAPIWLEVTNPGYAQFVTTSAPQTDSKISLSTTSSSDESEQVPAGIFRRRLYMPGSKFAEHNYGSTSNQNGHHKQLSIGSETGNTTSDSSLPPSARREERHSVDLGSLHNATTNGKSTDTTNPDRRSRPSKGYTFASPWSGLCEFSTAATGRSLKCRHFLPFHVTGYGDTVAEVSELRFNLPTTSNTTSRRLSTRGGGGVGYFSLHNNYQHIFSEEEGDGQGGHDASPRSPTFIFDEDGRMDLSLGQERAGGGFGGKQAKLGKLIVLPAGLGMLDLLVAANLGLFWRGWEKI